MRNKATIALLALTVVCSLCQADDQAEQNIIEGSLTHTARPNGQWKAWFNAAGAYTVAAGPEAMWFCKGGTVWRYNVRTQQVDVHMPTLVQPSIDLRWDCASSADGKFATDKVLWNGQEWVHLPTTGGVGFDKIVFDAEGDLWTIGQKAYRWEGRQWSAGVVVAKPGGIWPFGNKWLVSDRDGFDTFFRIVDAEFNICPNPPQSPTNARFLQRVYQSANHTYAIFQFQQLTNPPPGGLQGVFEVTDNAMVERVRGRYVGLDLSRDECFGVEWPAADGTPGQFAFKSPTGQTLLQTYPPPGGQFWGEAFRDANGHYWIGPFRYDGRQWQAMLPPDAFVYTGDLTDGIRQGRLKLDEQKQTWVDAWPEIPSNVRLYDPATRTGWVATRAQRTDPLTLEKCHYAPDGTPTKLESFTLDTEAHRVGAVALEDDGQLWFQGIYRWDGKEIHSYADTSTTRPAGRFGLADVVRDKTGGVWTCGDDKWMKYDGQEDKFHPAEPFDAFAFQAGPQTLAVVDWPRRYGPYDSLYGQGYGAVYCKQETRWAPFELGVLGGLRGLPHRTENASAVVGVSGRMLHNDRLLFSCQEGAFELDCKTGQWAYLASGPDVLALFDDRGRRLLVTGNNIGQIFLFDGETIDPTAGTEKLADLEAQVAALLARMDDGEWTQRDRATKDAINLARRKSDQVVAILKGETAKKHSPEVQARLAYVLRQVGPELPDRGLEVAEMLARRAIGNSLLDRMHPYPAPDISYVLEPGMTFQHVKSMFEAAGAKRASNVSGRGKCGFVLPDGTVAYLTLDGDDDAAKLVTIGLGEMGKAEDLKWKWDDGTLNGLKSLTLKPNLARAAGQYRR